MESEAWEDLVVGLRDSVCMGGGGGGIYLIDLKENKKVTILRGKINILNYKGGFVELLTIFKTGKGLEFFLMIFSIIFLTSYNVNMT